MTDKVLLSVRDSDITVRETERVIADLQRENPDYEVFLDGDLYAIVGRPRRRAYQSRSSEDFRNILGMVQ